MCVCVSSEEELKRQEQELHLQIEEVMPVILSETQSTAGPLDKVRLYRLCLVVAICPAIQHSSCLLLARCLIGTAFIGCLPVCVCVWMLLRIRRS